MDVDGVLLGVGSPGKFHILLYIVLCFNYIPVAVNHLSMTIYGAKTEHVCDEFAPLENETRSKERKRFELSSNNSCSVWNNATNLTAKCHHWKYFGEPGEKNIIMEWDLVCERRTWSSHSTSVYFSGVMLGGVLFGTAADRFGRKPIVLFTLYTYLLVGVALSFANSFWNFAALRFALGVLMQGLQTSTYVLLLEQFSTKYRTVVGTVFEVFWGFSVLWLAFLSWLIRDWRYIQLALALPSVLTISYYWIIPESVRWLLTHGKIDAANAVIKRASRFNGVAAAENSFQKLESSQDENKSKEKDAKSYNVMDMFRTPRLRRRSLVLFYVWMVVAVGYYGLSLSITSLAGNKYLNLFIGGCVELPAYCAVVFILQKFGRRGPLSFYLCFGGIFCIVAGLTPAKSAAGTDIRWVSTLLAITGRFGMAGAFSVILIYTCELFPTVIRNVSMGMCAFWTRLGGMLVPQIILLGQVTYTELPIVVLGAMALIGGLLTLLLPETLNLKMADTIEEAESLGRTIDQIELDKVQDTKQELLSEKEL